VWHGTEIEPGDVINFLGGMFTIAGYPRYGHTALYLGRDPQTGVATFLGFERTVEQDKTRAFYGRILGEKEFLQKSAEWHSSFDVFRLEVPILFSTSDPRPDPTKLLQAAKLVAERSWDPTHTFGELCSDAVADVLSNATGYDVRSHIHLERSWDPEDHVYRWPSDFASDPWFKRVGTSITVDTALHPTEEDHNVVEQLEKQRRRAALLRWTAAACHYIETNRAMLMHQATYGAPSNNLGWEILQDQNKELRSDKQKLLQIQVVMTKDEMTDVLQSSDWESTAADAIESSKSR
jgi:hypothetical protein